MHEKKIDARCRQAVPSLARLRPASRSLCATSSLSRAPRRSVTSKNKKMYLLVGLEPTREITGGSFYSGVEFDHELIRVLSQSSLAYIQRKEVATASEVHAFIGESGLIRGKQLRLEDVDAVLQTLVYDARAEVSYDPRHGSEHVYRVVQRLPSVETMVDSLMHLPPAQCECPACLVGLGQPCHCLTAWLEAIPAQRES